MKYYHYWPEVAGSFGANTVYVGKKSDQPVIISKLHYEFSSWPKDDFIGMIDYYIGTERLKNALEAMSPSPTGIEFDLVEVSGDEDEFDAVYREGRPDSALGKWHWFKITGQPGKDDFGQILGESDLIVSERVARVLMQFCVPFSVRKLFAVQAAKGFACPEWPEEYEDPVMV